LVDGLINDCARIIAEKKTTEDWFDLSTLKEPYRVEGKKTMGYEIAEQLDWHLPDVIIYPTGGGTGLIGMGPHPASSIWMLFGETCGEINWTVALWKDHYGESDPQDQPHNATVGLQQPLKYSHRGPP